MSIVFLMVSFIESASFFWFRILCVIVFNCDFFLADTQDIRLRRALHRSGLIRVYFFLASCRMKWVSSQARIASV